MEDPESSTLKLVMLQGPREGETLEFKPGSTVRIGRLVRGGGGNAIQIKDDGISSKHLTIESEPSGKWVITDCGSSNGTLLNDSKIPPSAPFDLRDGDFVKIGEYTSIRVEIGVQVDDNVENGSQLRRNPKRGKAAAPAKDLGKESVEAGLGNKGQRGGGGGGSKRGKGLKVDEEDADALGNAGSVAENRSRRLRGVSKKNEVELGNLIIEIPDAELENAGPAAGNHGWRGGSNRTRAVKEVGNETELGSVSEVHDQGLENGGVRGGGLRRGRSLKEKELENVQVVVESKPRRGRPPKAKKMNNGVANVLTEVQDLSNNVGGVEEENVPQVVVESKPRRGRPPKAKKMTNGVANVLTEVQDLPNNVGGVEEENVPQVISRTTRSSKTEIELIADQVFSDNDNISSSKTRGSLKGKNKLQDEAGDSDGTGVVEEKVDMNGLDSRDKPKGTSEEKENVSVNDLDSWEENLEAAAICTSEGKENVEGVNLGSDTFKESASGSGAKQSSVNVGDEIDLEKMTLGEWLDFLEVYLPKQIYEETEEMISKMEEKAKRFHDFMAKQQNDKGGLGRGVL